VGVVVVGVEFKWVVIGEVRVLVAGGDVFMMLGVDIVGDAGV
jgi:hypothetical protein